jgi:serine/threonine protein kinase
LPEDTFDAGRLGAYTEAYATAEMIAGGDAAAADDVYALGIIAYQLLTSRHPFARNSAPKARELGLAPAPIRQLQTREWKALAQALAFDRTRRPKDASEFLRLFFGAPARRRALIAATIVLALASTYLGYANYREAGPSVPFEQLPAATQQKLTSLMSDGDREWGFYAKEGTDYALWSSVDLFSEAYSLHPRDRRAVGGLRRAADALLKQNQSIPDRQRQVAKALSEKSEYLAKYKPVAKLLGN